MLWKLPKISAFRETDFIKRTNIILQVIWNFSHNFEEFDWTRRCWFGAVGRADNKICGLETSMQNECSAKLKSHSESGPILAFDECLTENMVPAAVFQTQNAIPIFSSECECKRIWSQPNQNFTDNENSSRVVVYWNCPSLLRFEPTKLVVTTKTSFEHRHKRQRMDIGLELHENVGRIIFYEYEIQFSAFSSNNSLKSEN
jgi:hypothetical protein